MLINAVIIGKGLMLTSLFFNDSLSYFLNKNFNCFPIEKEGVGGEREVSVCCSTYLCIHWLILFMP